MKMSPALGTTGSSRRYVPEARQNTLLGGASPTKIARLVLTVGVDVQLGVGAAGAGTGVAIFTPPGGSVLVGIELGIVPGIDVLGVLPW
jgi:hypothetical protein